MHRWASVLCCPVECCPLPAHARCKCIALKSRLFHSIHGTRRAPQQPLWQRYRLPASSMHTSSGGGMWSGCHAASTPASRYAAVPVPVQEARVLPWLVPCLRALVCFRARETGGGGRAHKPCPHAWLQARWRRYLYLLPLRQTTASAAPLSIGTQTPQAVPADVLTTAAAAATAAGIPDVDVARVHALLQPLVGQCMNYTSFARDTPAGKDCTCRLLQARAWRAALPGEPGAASSTQRALPCNIAFCPVLVQQPACW